MDAWKRTATAWNALTPTTDYQENVTYDPNGNITAYSSNAHTSGSGNAMDKLSYSYIPKTNQLDHIIDAVPGSQYNDISTQDTTNYKYDAIGELTSDDASHITRITWTVYGKIDSIIKAGDTTIKYTYDPSGNRISKSLTHAGQTESTWYVRDAQGNILSVYTDGDPTVNGGNLAQTELDIYGSSRLGIWKRLVDVESTPLVTSSPMPLLGWGDSLIFTRGKKLFELTNHLGNVLAAISDKRYGVSADDSTITYFNPDVVSANDYYPFGMLQSARSYTEPNVGNYRYGFNGKENDNEVKGQGNQVDFGNRIYDSRIARWSSLDPLQAKYANEAPYVYVSGNPLIYIDEEGKERVIVIKTYHKDGRVTIIRKVDPDFFVHRSEWTDMSAINGYPSLKFNGTRESVYENYVIDENNPKVMKSTIKTKVDETFNSPITYGIDRLRGDKSGNEKYGYVIFGQGHDGEIDDRNEKAAPGSEILDIDKMLSALQAMRDIPTENFANPDIKDFIFDEKRKSVFDGVDNFVKAVDATAAANGGDIPFGPKELPWNLPGDYKSDSPVNPSPHRKHVDTVYVPGTSGVSGPSAIWDKAGTDSEIIYMPKPTPKN